MKAGLKSMSFVERVFTMLEDSASEGFDNIIGWESDGKSFKVYMVKEFEEKIQPLYLNQTKLRSFQRKLIAHGFTSIQGGPSRGAYHHEKFVKGRRDLCLEIMRKNSSSNPESAPNSGGDLNIDEITKQAVLAAGIFGGFDGVKNEAAAETISESATLSELELGPAPLSQHFIQAVIESKPQRRSACSTATTPSMATQHMSNVYQPEYLTYQMPLREEDAPPTTPHQRQTRRWLSANAPLVVVPSSTTVLREEPIPQYTSNAVTMASKLSLDTFNQSFAGESAFLLNQEEEDGPPKSIMVGAGGGYHASGASRLAESLSISLFSMDLDDVLLEEDKDITKKRTYGGSTSKISAAAGTTNGRPPLRGGSTTNNSVHTMMHMSGGNTSRQSKRSFFSSINSASFCDGMSLDELGGSFLSGESNSSFSMPLQQEPPQPQHHGEGPAAPDCSLSLGASTVDSATSFVFGRGGDVAAAAAGIANPPSICNSSSGVLSDPFTPRPIASNALMDIGVLSDLGEGGGSGGITTSSCCSRSTSSSGGSVSTSATNRQATGGAAAAICHYKSPAARRG